MKQLNKKKSIFYSDWQKFILPPLLFLLILLFLFPRSIELLNQNPIFGFDQGREYLAAWNIVVNHKLILIGTELGAGSAGINGIFHGPIYYYLLTIPFVLFSGNPAGGTYLIFTLNILSAVLLFYFVKKIMGLWPAIAAAFLMAVSPVFISQARFLWSPNPTALFILLSFYFTYRIKKIGIATFFAAFFAAFVYNFEMGIAVPLCISLLLYSIFIFKKNFRSYLYLFCGFFTGFLPMVLFEVRHHFLAFSGILSYLLSNHASVSDSGSNFILDHFSSMILNMNITFGLHQVISGNLLYLLPVILLGSTLYYYKKESEIDLKNIILFFFLTIITTFWVFSFLRNALYDYYLTDLSIIYIIFFVYILYSSFKYKDILFHYILIAAVILSVVYAIPLQLRTSLKDFSDYGGTAKLKGKIDAVDYIYRDARREPFGLLVFSPPVYTYPYDYIVKWYGQKKYGYTPYAEKKERFTF